MRSSFFFICVVLHRRRRKHRRLHCYCLHYYCLHCFCRHHYRCRSRYYGYLRKSYRSNAYCYRYKYSNWKFWSHSSIS